jgi:HYR domain
MQKDWMVGSATTAYRDSNNVTRLTMQADMRYVLEPVADTTPPVLTLPANITVAATSPAGAVVNFAATALDNLSGAVPVSYSVQPGSTFPIGTTTVEVTATDDLFNAATGSFTVTVERRLTALGAAEVWVGLKNSDDVGLRVDLLAEVRVAGTKVGEGHLDNVPAGSSGFQNAVRNVFQLALANGPVAVPAGAVLDVVVSVRRTCAPVGHVSGTARLWYDGKAVDTGALRDAGSGFVATIAGVEAEYYLRASQALNVQPGSSKVSVDKAVDSKQPCASRWAPFGTWSVALP